MRLNRQELIAHHTEAKTPLRVLGNFVRHCEESYKDTGYRHYFIKARIMRAVITAVFVARYTAGEYHPVGDVVSNDDEEVAGA